MTLCTIGHSGIILASNYNGDFHNYIISTNSVIIVLNKLYSLPLYKTNYTIENSNGPFVLSNGGKHQSSKPE